MKSESLCFRVFVCFIGLMRVCVWVCCLSVNVVIRICAQTGVDFAFCILKPSTFSRLFFVRYIVLLIGKLSANNWCCLAFFYCNWTTNWRDLLNEIVWDITDCNNINRRKITGTNITQDARSHTRAQTHTLSFASSCYFFLFLALLLELFDFLSLLTDRSALIRPFWRMIRVVQKS